MAIKVRENGQWVNLPCNEVSNITQGGLVNLDTTLTKSGYAADAKAVGDKIGNLSDLITEDQSNLVAAINEAANSGGGNEAFIVTLDILNMIASHSPKEIYEAVQEGQFVIGQFKYSGTIVEFNLLAAIYNPATDTSDEFGFAMFNCHSSDHSKTMITVNLDKTIQGEDIKYSTIDKITEAKQGQIPIVAKVNSSGQITQWNVIDFPKSIIIDETLTISGAAADAKVVGDSLKQLNNIIIQDEEPTNAEDGALWLDTDEKSSISSNENSKSKILTVTLNESADTIIASHSASEIFTAYKDGKIIQMIMPFQESEFILPLVISTETNAAFILNYSIPDHDDVIKFIVSIAEDKIATKLFGSSKFPPSVIAEEDAGKVLSVSSTGDLIWITHKNDDENIIPTPTESDYGKVLSATANGLAWEEQTQSNYEQNNETAADYIKNRPFYEFGENIEIPILEETTLTFEIINNGCVFEGNANTVLEENTTYIVTVDGTSYTYVCKTCPMTGTHYLGASYMECMIFIEQGIVPAEPLAILDMQGVAGIVLFNSQDTSHTISVQKVVNVVNSIIIDQTYTLSLSDDTYVTYLPSVSLIRDATYTVTIDDTEYTFVANNTTYLDDINGYMIETEKFMLGLGKNFSCIIYNNESTSTDATIEKHIKVTGYTSGIKTIDKKYIDIDPLPYVTSSDNNKVLGVVNGKWDIMSVPKELPSYTSSDYGKFLSCTSNGVVWVEPTLPSVEEATF